MTVILVTTSCWSGTGETRAVAVFCIGNVGGGTCCQCVFGSFLHKGLHSMVQSMFGNDKDRVESCAL